MRCSESKKLEDGTDEVISNSPSEEVTAEQGPEGGKEQPRKDLAEESFRQRSARPGGETSLRSRKHVSVLWRPLCGG